MKNIKQHKLTTMAFVALLLVAMMTVAIQGLTTTGPDADGYMTYTIDTAADECIPDGGGNAFGEPFAKYDLGEGGGFTFDGSDTDNDLFIVTYQDNEGDTDTATIQLDPAATTSFSVTFVSAKQSTTSCKYLINVILDPGDKIVGLPAPDNGNDFSHVSVYGAEIATETTTATTTPMATTTTMATTTMATTTMATTTMATTTMATTTMATTAATTGPTATLGTTAETIVVTEPSTPLVSIVVTTATAAPTTATMILPTEEVPLADTGESISWSTIAGILVLMAGSIIFWKRQVAKNDVR